MGFETVHLARLLEVNYDAPGGATARITTDLPNVGTVVNSTLPATIGRQVKKVTISARGKLWKFRFDPVGYPIRLYGARLYARAVGLAASDWQWWTIPLPETPEAWTEITLAIPPTPDTWTEVPLAIPPTPDSWTDLEIPIERTGDTLIWSEIAMDA